MRLAPCMKPMRIYQEFLSQQAACLVSWHTSSLSSSLSRLRAFRLALGSSMLNRWQEKRHCISRVLPGLTAVSMVGVLPRLLPRINGMYLHLSVCQLQIVCGSTIVPFLVVLVQEYQSWGSAAACWQLLNRSPDLRVCSDVRMRLGHQEDFLVGIHRQAV